MSGNACTFNAVQHYVAGVIEGKILIGHSIWNDLSGKKFFTSAIYIQINHRAVLGIPHPAVNTRDVALYLV
ncbi:hypothetical protein H0H81_012090 [Sphagnurus paluster]|uniref:Exonuclease domain-containing protein n=1 Tax=Sphagnurus paluster TaxID=117069 RepID=A0A9P7GS59_9AGAR|nr:hypothetical protein H0H81_012090 [Sphagnurus paluster]